MGQVKFNLFQYSPSDTEIPAKLISAHTFAYISLDAMIPQPEADKTHIACGFPVPKTGDLSHVVTFSDHVHKHKRQWWLSIFSYRARSSMNWD